MVSTQGRKRLVIGNWKMHGSLGANAALLGAVADGAKGLPETGVAVCAPFPYLAQCRELLAGSPVAWGAQDVSAHLQGAYTGEVAAPMLAEFGCGYVLVGHSERRAYHGETDALVVAKAARALEAGLTPVICVGETLAQREAGETEAVVGAQLDVALDLLHADQLAKVVLAYEPVWAIGTGKTATSEQAQAVHAFLRGRVDARNAAAAKTMPILYGGSVKPGNAAELFAMQDIDGGLIGGASLAAADFLAICGA
ncbi:MAG: triose-phosphate isomerase [Candidatus Protistobacter heckmanni]|nr:triose-phosphate isomerase [Candidatus Protistobacter heckmanni]